MNKLIKILPIIATSSLLGFILNTQAENYILSNNMGEDLSIQLFRTCNGQTKGSSVLVKAGEQNHKFSAPQERARCCLSNIVANSLPIAPNWTCGGSCGSTTNITASSNGTITLEPTCILSFSKPTTIQLSPP